MVRMAIIKKSTNNTSWRGCGEKGRAAETEGNVHSPALQPGAPCLTTEAPRSTARETRQGRTGGDSLRTERGQALLQEFLGKGLQARVQTLKPDGRALALTLNNQKTWCEGLPGGSVVKNPPAMQETQVQSLGQDYPLQEGMATHSSILSWRIPRTEKP